MRIMEAALAGTGWYPGSAAALERELRELVAAVPEREVPPGLRGLLVPHAAYRYSGRAAAHAYALAGHVEWKRVVLLAPSHFHRFRGAALLAADAYRTLLGDMPVDRDAARTLVAAPLVREDAGPFQREHALELQVPFLQVTVGQVPIVPLAVGTLEKGDAGVLAAAIRPLLGPQTLAIASSDLTHYGAQFNYLPFPPRDAASVRSELAALDGGVLEQLGAVDPEGFEAYLDETGATVCGRMALAVMLRALPQGSRGEVLCYYTSLDLTGDYLHSVSYAAVAFAAR